jgi:hypothetical protein
VLRRRGLSLPYEDQLPALVAPVEPSVGRANGLGDPMRLVAAALRACAVPPVCIKDALGLGRRRH